MIFTVYVYMIILLKNILLTIKVIDYKIPENFKFFEKFIAKLVYIVRY